MLRGYSLVLKYTRWDKEDRSGMRRCISRKRLRVFDLMLMLLLLMLLLLMLLLLMLLLVVIFE